jgi:hypothetical protein
MKNIPYWIIGTAMTAGLVAAAAVSDEGPIPDLDFARWLG